MYMRALKYIVLVFMALLVEVECLWAQTVSDSANLSALSQREYSQYMKKLRRDSIRANKAVWLSILGGPSYTPEASLGVGGALLASFKINKNDSISQRSYIPAGFNVSINGTFIFLPELLASPICTIICVGITGLLIIFFSLRFIYFLRK